MNVDLLIKENKELSEEKQRYKEMWFTTNNSLAKYRKLEEQLSCPLEVVFKAREGFYTNVGFIQPEHIFNIDIKNQTIEFEWLEDGCWNEDGLVEFENYKKNWWLNGYNKAE